jgi:hypothetical protein
MSAGDRNPTLPGYTVRVPTPLPSVGGGRLRDAAAGKFGSAGYGGVIHLLLTDMVIPRLSGKTLAD